MGGLVALAAAGCGGEETVTVTVTTGASPSATQATTETSDTADASAKLLPINVVLAFQDAGLEAEQPRAMTRDDYGLAPLLAIEGLRFLIPSLGPDSGGRVMRFESQEDLQKTKQYYDELGRSSAAFFSWTFAEGLTLVQINGELPDAKARRYEAVLGGLG